jgi:hypothetical protein
MKWVANKSSPIFRAQFQTSLGLRRPAGLVQYIHHGRVRDIVTFTDAYSIEASGRLIRFEPDDPSRFIIEYDNEIVRNQWGSVISKRELSWEYAVECKETLAGDFRNVYYVDAPELYIIYEPTQET